MNSWKVILATMFIFGTGVVTGGLLVRHSDRIGAPHPQSRPGSAARPAQPGSAGMRLEFLRRMEKDLDLTPEQRGQIDKILKESQEHTKKLLEPVSPRIREEVQRTKERFREVLGPEQRARFDALAKQQQRPRDQRKQSAPRVRPLSPPGTNSPGTLTNL